MKQIQWYKLRLTFWPANKEKKSHNIAHKFKNPNCL